MIDINRATIFAYWIHIISYIFYPSLYKVCFELFFTPSSVTIDKEKQSGTKAITLLWSALAIKVRSGIDVWHVINVMIMHFEFSFLVVKFCTGHRLIDI